MDTDTDVLADVLATTRLTNLVFGRMELGAPWCLSAPKRGHFNFYVVLRGSAALEVEGEARPIALSAGDVALLPRGPAHWLRDPAGHSPALHELTPSTCRHASAKRPTRIGGDGPVTSLIAGCFRFSEGSRVPFLESLPPVLHLPAADTRVGPWLGATVQLIVAESIEPGLASSIVLGRLADVLLVQALRLQASTGAREKQAHGLCALADPVIGAALALMHGHPAKRWTVDSLASEVGLSRSGFAARFHELVGEPPLQYLSRWRMTKAAQLLRESEESLAAVAERMGYKSEPAFHKAFKRWQGEAPGAYRRNRGGSPDPFASGG